MPVNPLRASRGSRVLTLALVVDSVGNGLFLPLSLVYFVALTDVPLTEVGLLLSVANLLTLPVPIWAGSLADRIGPRPLVVAAQLLQAAGFLAYTVVREPVAILVAATAVSVGVRLFWSAIFPLITDVAEHSDAERTKDAWFAVANIARTVGLAVGGLVAGAIVAAGSAGAYRGVAVVSAGSFVVAALLLATSVRAPHRRERNVRGAGGYAGLVRDRPFLALIAVNTAFALSSMMLAIALPTVVSRGLHGPAWFTAVVLAGNAVLTALLSAPLVRRLAGYRRTRALMIAAVLWTVAGIVMAPLGPGAPIVVALVLGLVAVLFTLAEAIHAPLSTALAEAIAPVETRGRYLSTFQYSFAIASVIGPGFFGVLFDHGHALPWLALAVLDVVALGALLVLERRLPAETLRSPLPASAIAPASAPAPTRPASATPAD